MVNPDFTVPELYPLRLAVRSFIKKYTQNNLDFSKVAVGLSGGADSLALTAALVAEELPVQAIIVDHQLQADSADFSAAAAEKAHFLGCDKVEIISVSVGTIGGMEAAAREARYAALQDKSAGKPVFLAHTMDDQAETVLLGLGRGAGSKSIMGMKPVNFPWSRPLLSIRRAQTEAACRALGIEPFHDPQNEDTDFTRVKLRKEVIPLLEKTLHSGVVEALSKTASFLQQDDEVIEQIVEANYSRVKLGDMMLVKPLETLSTAIRIRILKKWLTDNGVSFSSAVQLQAIDNLLTAWKGQGPIAVKGKIFNSAGIPVRLVVSRENGRLVVSPENEREQ